MMMTHHSSDNKKIACAPLTCVAAERHDRERGLQVGIVAPELLNSILQQMNLNFQSTTNEVCLGGGRTPGRSCT